MKLELKLNSVNAEEEIIELNDYIKEHNLKGLISKVLTKEPEKNSMSVNEYMPIIQLVLGSTVVAAGVKGLFDIIKSYFELKKQKISSNVDMEKNSAEKSKIEFQIETKAGKKINLKFNSFDDKERLNFFTTLDKISNE